MSHLIKRIFLVVIGLFLSAVGAVFVIKGNLGYMPWEVFHSGLGLQMGMPLGTVSILMGFVFVAIDLILKEKVGLGTLLNMLLFGIFANILLLNNIIPAANGFIFGIVWIVTGSFFSAVGAYMYIKQGFGAGPKDSLMSAFTKKSHLPVGICKILLDGSAVVIGYFTGGSVGIGTLISTIALGVWVQIVFSVMKFDVKSIQHEDLLLTMKNTLGLLPFQSK